MKIQVLEIDKEFLSETKKDGFDPKKVSLVCSCKNKTHKSMIFKIKTI